MPFGWPPRNGPLTGGLAAVMVASVDRIATGRKRIATADWRLATPISYRRPISLATVPLLQIPYPWNPSNGPPFP